MSTKETAAVSPHHWDGVPERNGFGERLSDADRERLRLEVGGLWPEALALARKTELLSVDVFGLARGIRASHPNEWRELFLKKLEEMRDHPEAFRPRFTGALIGQAHEKLERMIGEVHPDDQLAALQELVALLEKRKSAKKAEYR